MLEQAIGVPFVDGNTIEELQNGIEIFPAMLNAIEQARHRIDFATFVYWQGDIAERFANSMAQRASEGVCVHVLLDAFGAKRINPTLIDRMEQSGVDVRWFRPLATWRLWRSDKRMHRKLLICDDSNGFTGGVGIAQEWEGNARSPAEWRDTHVRIQGPALSVLRSAFLDNWNEAGDWSFEPYVGRSQHSGDVPIQVVRASTTIGWTNVATLLRSLVALSTETLYVTTAYFNPDDRLVELLIEAASRGVDVRILTPGRYSDSRLSQLAGHDKVERLVNANVKIWLYNHTMLHAKIVTVDSHIACVGSANFNHRSLSKDEECCIVALSDSFSKSLDQSFFADCERAEPVDRDRWSQRSFWMRLAERAARAVQEQV